MNFLSKKNPDRWHQLAWWLCVVTLPWYDMATNFCLILIGLLSLTGPHLKERILRLKSATWTWPFFIYYALLLIGMIYTPDVDNGLFTLDKKITFVALPLIAVIGRELNAEFMSVLKRSFVYSCSALVLLCLILAAADFTSGGLAANFDVKAAENYNALHPDVSSAWMHFSYIQLAKWVKMHPAYFSMYLVFCLVILFTEKCSSRMEVVHLLLSIIISGFMAMLSTRIAMVAFFSSTLYLLIKKIQARQLKSSVKIFMAASIIGLLLYFNPVARFRVVEEPAKTTYRTDTTFTEWNSVNYRLLEWEGSWSIIRSHLFLGIGTTGWRVALVDFYSKYNPTTAGLLYNSHNQFLQIWMENGIFALLAFLFCIYGSIFNGRMDQSHVAFILIFSLMCMTESIMERQKGIMFFMLFQTLFLAFENKSK